MVGEGVDWHVTAFLAARDETGLMAVERVRELRARILFDGGRRPAFRDDHGTPTDVQDLDFGAWHFVGRRTSDGPPLGYVRLCTPAVAALFQSRVFLGDERYRQVLDTEGLTDAEVFEHSRLVVECEARGQGLGTYLNAMAIAAAQVLGARAMIGTSGTADGQDRFHGRFGFHPVESTRRYVGHYAEDVVVLLHRAAEGAGEHTDLVARLRTEFPALAISGLVHPQRSMAPEPSPARHEVWRPVLHRQDRQALVDLLASGEVREVCDTIEAQLEELIRCREPSRHFGPAEMATAKRRELAGAEPWAYGTWAFYPWSGRLVHVLPQEEFRLVRTDRNRGKIERPQQQWLLSHRIGFVGLSVGNCAALTFALEGIGGAFRLADFDDLGLSNLNRLRAGVHHLGVNKTVIAARELFEIDPYLDIEIFPGGLTDACMAEFLTGLDVLVEECDTPYVKVAAREQARALGIPVIMDANDRGLLDIERFDLEPTRPLLHGLLGDVTSAELADLTVQQKVDLILAMVDAERISPQLAAAIPQIGVTLSSWPQLASGVALGGALTAEAARRILLGEPCPSGRYYADLERLIAIERSVV